MESWSEAWLSSVGGARCAQARQAAGAAVHAGMAHNGGAGTARGAGRGGAGRRAVQCGGGLTTRSASAADSAAPRQPVQAVKQALARRGAAGLHKVGPRGSDSPQAQLLGDLGARQRAGDVLLVGEDEQRRARHLAVLDDARELGARLVHALAVRRVDDEDEALGAREVVAPQRADLVLAADVPHVELCVLVGDRLDVEADGGHRGRTTSPSFSRYRMVVLPAASRPTIRMRSSRVVQK